MFLYFFLLILKICYTFVAVNRLATTYQTTIAQQRNFNLFAFFSALYLVVSDILLTHTHTHTQALLTSKPIFFVLSYARAKRGVTLVNKGLHGVSFVGCFVLFPERKERQYKERLVGFFQSTNTCSISSKYKLIFSIYYDSQIGVPLLWDLSVCKFCKCKRIRIQN